MKQEIITMFNNRIQVLFEEVKSILLEQHNYNQKVDTQSLSYYFAFLEQAFQQPYNRLSSLSNFINDGENLFSDLMYPLVHLKDESKEMIHEKSKQACNLARGLDVSGIDPEYSSLVQEKHLNIKQNSSF